MRSIFFIAFLIFTNTVFSQAVNGVKTVNGVPANSSGEITISGGSGITLPQLTDSLNVIRGNKLSNITGLVTAGTGATVTGSGTSGSPYVIGASGGGGGITTDSTLISTAAQTAFAFTAVPSNYADYLILINGVAIEPITYFSTVGNIVTFTSGLVIGDRVRFKRIK